MVHFHHGTLLSCPAAHSPQAFVSITKIIRLLCTMKMPFTDLEPTDTHAFLDHSHMAYSCGP